MHLRQLKKQYIIEQKQKEETTIDRPEMARMERIRIDQTC